MSNIFDTVETLVVPRSFQKLSQTLRTTYNFGKIYPCFVMSCVAGDTIKVGLNVLNKAQPMVSSPMTPITQYFHSFFVPFRLLDSNFEAGLARCTEDGQEFVYDFPVWSPTDRDIQVGSLWDYFGLPLNVTSDMSSVDHTNVKGVEPTAYLRRAYNLVYNEWFRNENLIEKVDLDSTEIQRRCWRKDYFTSALPFQQKPASSELYALPVNSSIVPDYDDSGDVLRKRLDWYRWTVSSSPVRGYSDDVQLFGKRVDASFGATGLADGKFAEFGTDFGNVGDYVRGYPVISGDDLGSVASVSSATFTVSDMRLAFQCQKWAERNARGGTRYTEFLRSHFGVYPKDYRLQRPEFVGGMKIPILIGDSIQSSATQDESASGYNSPNPQGTRSGIGNGVGGDFLGKFHVEEPGIYIVVTSILPNAEYSQGVDRQWILHNQLDFYFPEFSCLSEREVKQGELCCCKDSDEETARKYNETIFGFQGMYNEFRFFPNKTTGLMRTVYSHWHQSRTFGCEFLDDEGRIIPTDSLNKDFVECTPTNRIFAVTDEDPFMCQMRFDVKAYRPITYKAEPGLIDHF